MTKNNPAWNKNWSEAPYELTLVAEDGSVRVNGLQLCEAGFILSDVYFSYEYTPMVEDYPMVEADERR